jgi:hypothetical protein
MFGLDGDRLEPYRWHTRRCQLALIHGVFPKSSSPTTVLSRDAQSLPVKLIVCLAPYNNCGLRDEITFRNSCEKIA